MSARDLRELASAADMRPPFKLALVWTSEYGSGYALETPEHYLPVICNAEEDAEFIAAASPQRVLALLDDLAAAEARVANLEAGIRALADVFAARGITAPGRGQPPLVGAAYIKASVDLRALLGDETTRSEATP